MALLSTLKGFPADPPGNRSYMRGLDRRSGPARQQYLSMVSGSVTPNFRRGLKKKRSRDKDKDKEKVRKEFLQKSVKTSADPLDGVTADLAKVVVNMQQYYASGVDELAEKLGSMEEELRRAKEENVRMKERLDMHFGMLGQTAEFMQRINEGMLDRGVDDDLDMEVPPALVDDGVSLRSTGRMAGLKKKKVAARVSNLPEEERTRGGDSDEDVRILQGAPRLQEAIRQDVMRRAISRQSRFTPINRIPSSRQSTPSSGDDDSDEYRPSSPSTAASCCSSSSAEESPPSPSDYEEEQEQEEDTAPQLPTPPPSAPRKDKRYSTRRTIEDRHSSGTPNKVFRFHRMGRTVLDVWTEYKVGTMGNPAIEALERQYGTEWRAGHSTRELKYASNYVSVRQKVVRYVEGMCKREGISVQEAIGRLDERVDGRLQMLISAVRKGQDPFVVIPERRAVK
ncbi:hypothetical protein ACQKWADRAFT_326180 [Trichoderma austrokoningii]